ncbi:hypothetical protein FA95DRAFT_1463960, partial [Auriscalpium vulgare]
PCIIHDIHGKIMAWHLPRALSPRTQQGDMMHAAANLSAVFFRNVKAGKAWRDERSAFKDASTCRMLTPGLANISPAWFQQGHATPPNMPQVGAVLKTPAGQAWLYKAAESNAILSAVLSVVHPPLYRGAREVMLRLREQPDLAEAIDNWHSVFTGVAVISNRSTCLHRDTGGRFAWYDLLASCGPYHGAKLCLPAIGIELEYPPGTIDAVSGMSLAHSVPGFDGERLCHAFFMKDSVHHFARVEAPGWM